MTRSPKKRKVAKSKAINGSPTSAEEEHPPELFHYTNLGALRGILDSNELWATSAFHLNDSSEMQTLWPVLEEPMRSAFERSIAARPDLTVLASARGGAKQAAHRLSEHWIDTVRNSLFGGPGREGSIGCPFVTSFATHSSLGEDHKYHRNHGMLSQWRGYAGSNGVALVFATDGLRELLDRESKAHAYGKLLLGDAIYDASHKEIDEVVSKFADIAPIILDHDDRIGRKALANIVDDLINTMVRLKHRGFSEEFEHRIVAVPTPERLQSIILTSRDPPLKPVFHRRGTTTSVPYIRLFQGFGDPLPITRIIVGPSRTQRAVLEEVQDLVRGRGIVVQPSEIPYVGSA